MMSIENNFNTPPLSEKPPFENAQEVIEALQNKKRTQRYSEGDQLVLFEEALSTDPTQEPTLEELKQELRKEVENDLVTNFSMNKGNLDEVGTYYWVTANELSIGSLVKELQEKYGPAVRRWGHAATPKKEAHVILNEAVEYVLQQKLDGESNLGQAS